MVWTFPFTSGCSEHLEGGGWRLSRKQEKLKSKVLCSYLEIPRKDSMARSLCDPDIWFLLILIKQNHKDHGIYVQKNSIHSIPVFLVLHCSFLGLLFAWFSLCFFPFFFCWSYYRRSSHTRMEGSRSTSKMESRSWQSKPVSPVLMGRRQPLQLGRNHLRQDW